jgi:hypothetical protein
VEEEEEEEEDISDVNSTFLLYMHNDTVAQQYPNVVLYF